MAPTSKIRVGPKKGQSMLRISPPPFIPRLASITRPPVMMTRSAGASNTFRQRRAMLASRSWNCSLSIFFSLCLCAFVLFTTKAQGHAGIPQRNISFEENRGQGPSNARFLARGQGYNLVLTPDGNQLVLRHDGRGLSLTSRLV